MTDLKVIMNGDKDTRLDLGSRVEGKQCVAQKCLVNIATEQGSDRLAADRGTNLLRAALRGVNVDANTARHSGNFAAIDTLFYIRQTDAKTFRDSPDRLAAITIDLLLTDIGTLSYGANLTFADNTTTQLVTAVGTA